ncbi:MAG: tRNA (adenosine(37)-N6)-threonylcarbamoyltransferase complex dimerization subunit type 1 TsaB [Acidiferrobacterales bacterium]
MKILALDTATESCSVALTIEGAVIEQQVTGRQHAESILPLIDRLFAQAQYRPDELDVIAFGRGPGMFTSLRIGAGVAQGIAFAAGVPVVAVSSLAALAQGQPSDHVVALFDARMEQVYWGCYMRNEDGIMKLIGTEQVGAPAAVVLPEGDWQPAGSGWDQYESRLQRVLGGATSNAIRGSVPSARDVARLGEIGFQQGLAVPASQALPVYIRDDIARKSVA